jgi:hypothetical protein
LLTTAEVVGYVALGVGVLVVPLAMLLYRRRWRTRTGKEREDALEPLPWWLRLLGLAVVVAVVAGQTVVASTFLDELRRAREAGRAGDPGIGLPDPGTAGSAGTDLTPLIIAGVLLIAIALLAVAVAIRWRALDRPSAPAAVERRRAATQEALEVSLDALRREPDPRRAVIAAYAAMEGSLRKAGFGRAPSEAPLEYLRRVLDVSGLAEDHLQTITLLFQHARFSDHPVRESMRTEAIEALGGVRATFGGGA